MQPIARCIDISSAVERVSAASQSGPGHGPTHLSVVLHRRMIKSAADTDTNKSEVRQIDNREDADIFALVASDSEVAIDNCDHVR